MRIDKLLIFVGAFVAAPGVLPPLHAQEHKAAFKEATCDLPGVPPAAQKRLRCGTVAVPRLPADPDAGSYQLRVVILKAERQPTPRPDAIVLLPGGPGGSAVVDVAMAAAVATLPFAVDRDTVLIDLRGTGASEPQLCQEGAFDRWWVLFAADLKTDQLISGAAATWRNCLAEARALGHVPESFGSRMDADDIERVRQALGATAWNILGVSYGATTALTLASRHPESVRTLVLDSPGLGALTPIDIRQGWRRARVMLLAACASDPACQQAYPDLENELEAALARLERRPLHISTPKGEMVLNRGDFEYLLFGTLYANASFAPAMIRAAAQGRTEALTGPVMAGVGVMASTSLFTLAAVSCRDNPPDSKWFRSPSGGAALGFELVRSGDRCGSIAPEPAPDSPSKLTIPTLVLSGTLDPVVPPASGRFAASLVGSAARFVEFPAVGHAVVRQSFCAQVILGAFLNDPAARLDTSCVVETLPLRFAP